MVSAVITAAGNSTRFGRDKILADLWGEPVLIRALMPFQRCKEIEEIIVAVKEEKFKLYRKLIQNARLKKVKLVEGGEERCLSAYNASCQCRGEIIITHDGNRPLVSPWLIEKLIKETRKHQAVITAVPVTTTIKYAENSLVKKSLLRAKTWLAQTPQGFKRELLLRAYKRAIKEKYFTPTDDSELVARLGEKIKIIPGDSINIKITYPTDLTIARILFREYVKNRHRPRQS